MNVKKRIKKLERRLDELSAIIDKLNEPASTYWHGRIQNWQSLARVIDKKSGGKHPPENDQL